MNVELSSAVDNIKEISEDITLPRNVKHKLEIITEILENSGDISMRISKAIHELEDLVEEKNLQAYSRTQLFNIISILESF
jgi:uncharacterized protein (UPF0147 family)